MIHVAQPMRGIKRPLENSERGLPAKKPRLDEKIDVKEIISEASRPFSPFAKKWQLKTNEIVGRGSFGIVLRAKMGFVAKVLLPASDNTVLHITREIHNLRQLQQEEIPYTPRLKEFIFDKEFFLILEDGGPSLSTLFRNELCPPHKGVLILRQILEAQNHLASHNLIHGDLKALNICLKGTTIMLVDWASLTLGPSHTLHNCMTRCSGAPEIFLRHACTPKSDIWSIMTVMIEILTPEEMVGRVENYTPRLTLLHRMQKRMGVFPQNMIDLSPYKVRKRFFIQEEGVSKLQPLVIQHLSSLSTLLEQTKQRYLIQATLQQKEKYAHIWDCLIRTLLMMSALDPMHRAEAPLLLSELEKA